MTLGAGATTKNGVSQFLRVALRGVGTLLVCLRAQQVIVDQTARFALERFVNFGQRHLYRPLRHLFPGRC